MGGEECEGSGLCCSPFTVAARAEPGSRKTERLEVLQGDFYKIRKFYICFSGMNAQVGLSSLKMRLPSVYLGRLSLNPSKNTAQDRALAFPRVRREALGSAGPLLRVPNTYSLTAHPLQVSSVPTQIVTRPGWRPRWEGVGLLRKPGLLPLADRRPRQGWLRKARRHFG